MEFFQKYLSLSAASCVKDQEGIKAPVRHM